MSSKTRVSLKELTVSDFHRDMYEEGDFTFQVRSVVRGHHVYKTVWTPVVGERLSLSPEDENEHDTHAVAVLREEAVVGHAPRHLSRVFYFFLRHGRTITTEITCTGHRRYGCGLEVPCLYTLTGKPKFIKKAKQLLVKKKYSG